jgi:transposase-like protein
MSNKFKDPKFSNETAAREWFEAARWPQGPACPHCGSFKHYATKKAGRYRCGEKECRKDFTVTTGTVMERSHAPLTMWAAAFHLFASSKKGFSAHQLHRELGCQYNTAWFIHHRVMEAMRRGGLDLPPMGGDGEVVEADETYFHDKPEAKRRKVSTGSNRKMTGPWNKRTIVSLVERGGKVRSFHVEDAYAENVAKIVSDNIAKESRLHTDESSLYKKVGAKFAAHERVNHGQKEYARTNEDGVVVTTNTIEGYFSIFKRGMKGIYQHCDEKHLHRYVAEYDFRYNHREALGFDDDARMVAAVRGGEGKRLTYRQPH